MKGYIILVLAFAFVAIANSLPNGRFEDRVAKSCNYTECKLPNCKCSDTNIPGGLAPKDTPQFVILTFDDAVGVINIPYYREALYTRKNPDKCPIQAAFFISHEYTDYSSVHELHSKGMEIGLHSISHTALTSYWQNADVALLEKELADQRTLMANFAKIPADDIKGIRMPFLQMAGNNQFQMFQKNKFLYDLSWPTQSFIQPGLWPYTLKYLSTQDCVTGPPCPNESYPDVWVIPMLMWKDQKNIPCAMVDSCVNIPTDVKNLTDWMISEFNKQYNGNRAPFGFYIHAAWFNLNTTYFEAYKKFLDYVGSREDVFISSPTSVINWVKSPKTWKQMVASPSCSKTYNPTCIANTCRLCKDSTIDRWMTQCTSCPNSYPWLGNPLGQTLISC